MLVLFDAVGLSNYSKDPLYLTASIYVDVANMDNLVTKYNIRSCKIVLEDVFGKSLENTITRLKPCKIVLIDTGRNKKGTCKVNRESVNCLEFPVLESSFSAEREGSCESIASVQPSSELEENLNIISSLRKGRKQGNNGKALEDIRSTNAVQQNGSIEENHRKQSCLLRNHKGGIFFTPGSKSTPFREGISAVSDNSDLIVDLNTRSEQHEGSYCSVPCKYCGRLLCYRTCKKHSQEPFLKAFAEIDKNLQGSLKNRDNVARPLKESNISCNSCQGSHIEIFSFKRPEKKAEWYRKPVRDIHAIHSPVPSRKRKLLGSAGENWQKEAAAPSEVLREKNVLRMDSDSSVSEDSRPLICYVSNSRMEEAQRIRKPIGALKRSTQSAENEKVSFGGNCSPTDIFGAVVNNRRHKSYSLVDRGVVAESSDNSSDEQPLSVLSSKKSQNKSPMLPSKSGCGGNNVKLALSLNRSTNTKYPRSISEVEVKGKPPAMEVKIAANKGVGKGIYAPENADISHNQSCQKVHDLRNAKKHCRSESSGKSSDEEPLSVISNREGRRTRNRLSFVNVEAVGSESSDEQPLSVIVRKERQRKSSSVRCSIPGFENSETKMALFSNNVENAKATRPLSELVKHRNSHLMGKEVAGKKDFCTSVLPLEKQKCSSGGNSFLDNWLRKHNKDCKKHASLCSTADSPFSGKAERPKLITWNQPVCSDEESALDENNDNKNIENSFPLGESDEFLESRSRTVIYNGKRNNGKQKSHSRSKYINNELCVEPPKVVLDSTLNLTICSDQDSLSDIFLRGKDKSRSKKICSLSEISSDSWDEQPLSLLCEKSVIKQNKSSYSFSDRCVKADRERPTKRLKDTRGLGRNKAVISSSVEDVPIAKNKNIFANEKLTWGFRNRSDIDYNEDTETEDDSDESSDESSDKSLDAELLPLALERKRRRINSAEREIPEAKPVNDIRITSVVGHPLAVGEKHKRLLAEMNPCKVLLYDILNDPQYKFIRSKRLVRKPVKYESASCKIDKKAKGSKIVKGYKAKTMKKGRPSKRKSKPFASATKTNATNKIFRQTKKGLDYINSILSKYAPTDNRKRVFSNEKALNIINRQFVRDRLFWQSV